MSMLEDATPFAIAVLAVLILVCFFIWGHQQDRNIDSMRKRIVEIEKNVTMLILDEFEEYLKEHLDTADVKRMVWYDSPDTINDTAGIGKEIFWDSLMKLPDTMEFEYDEKR